MTRLVHITSAENEKKILNAGIKTNKYGYLFFMPHLNNFLISHQWARELKRSGIKNFMAVDFKLPDNEMVWFGKYSDQHKKLPLNQAMSLFLKEPDPLGFEFCLERKVTPKEIAKTRHIPKPMGWRYIPHAHGTKPCPCPMCLQKGGYKTQTLKENESWKMSRNEAKEIIKNSKDENQIWDAVQRLKGKWKKFSPEYLEHLMTSNDEYMLYDLILLLIEHKHPKTIEYMNQLTQHSIDEIKEDAREELEKLNLKDYGIRDN